MGVVDDDVVAVVADVGNAAADIGVDRLADARAGDDEIVDVPDENRRYSRQRRHVEGRRCHIQRRRGSLGRLPGDRFMDCQE